MPWILRRERVGNPYSSSVSPDFGYGLLKIPQQYSALPQNFQPHPAQGLKKHPQKQVFKHTLAFVRETAVPRVLPGWDRLRVKVLGRGYALTVIWTGTRQIRKLNRRYRGTSRATNVLTFPLEEKYGEIFLCVPVVRDEAVRRGETFNARATFLFIHALLHLAGSDHHSLAESEKMENKEKMLIAWYNKSVKRKA